MFKYLYSNKYLYNNYIAITNIYLRVYTYAVGVPTLCDQSSV